MREMKITDTQYIIVRHQDREHPHVHIVFNRIDNSGKTISDRNDMYRNEQLTDPNEPIRLNKFLANAGVCSRREADEFITAGV